MITVGRGEVVTVRVPTHEEGSYLFWEFATDNYDIGFGVYFEWTDSPNTAVSVHVSESSDDEDEEEGKHAYLYKLPARQSLLWGENRTDCLVSSPSSLSFHLAGVLSSDLNRKCDSESNFGHLVVSQMG